MLISVFGEDLRTRYFPHCCYKFGKSVLESILTVSIKNLNMYALCISVSTYLPYRNTRTFAEEAYTEMFSVALLVKQLETT